MREIKFRCFIDGTMQATKKLSEIAKLGYELSSDGIYMQCTGLLDKNGVDIYCSDIVVDTFNGTTYLLKETVMDCAIQGLYNESPKRFEVIGNIHENPELLNV